MLTSKQLALWLALIGLVVLILSAFVIFISTAPR